MQFSGADRNDAFWLSAVLLLSTAVMTTKAQRAEARPPVKGRGTKRHFERRALQRSNTTWMPAGTNKNQMANEEHWHLEGIVNAVQLGSGAFGVAYLSYLPGIVQLNERDNGNDDRVGKRQPLIFAMKETDLSRDSEKENFFAEVNFLKLLNSPYILRLYGYYVEERSMGYGLSSRTYGHLITEYASQADLYDAITKQGMWTCPFKTAVLTERQAMRYLVQVLLGLRQMHERGSGGIAHNDIKLDNIFLAENNVAKIGDLGLSCRVTRYNPNADVFCLQYAAPEVKQNRINQLPERQKLKRDVWALGVTLHEMLTDEQIISREEIRSQRISQEMEQLIGRMLTEDPFSRPSVAELLRHPTVRRHYEQLESSDLGAMEAPEIECREREGPLLIRPWGPAIRRTA